MIIFKEFTAEDKDALVSFLTGERWDFYSLPQIPEGKIIEQLSRSYFTGSGIKTFWICNDDFKIGLIRLFDLGEENDASETPLFDIKLKKQFRGKGIGGQAVKWLIEYVFTNFPQKNRLDATTRIDNFAMRRVLEKCGFVKEAHYRQAWPDGEGNKYDCAGYSVLKSDWENHTTTHVRFTD